MDLRWLRKNLETSWSYRSSFADFGIRMLWTYSAKIPVVWSQGDWTIGFSYPEPVGRLRLVLRGNRGADAFIHGEVFEHQYYYLPLNRSPTTILDLGANIGLSSVYFSRHFPGAEIVCVEPIPENVRLMKQNFYMNSVRATVVEAAIDPMDGSVLMELEQRDYAHKVVANAGSATRATLTVKALSVPTLLQQLAWDRIGLLKVDIEGHEAALFARNCSWLNLVDAMCIECHDGFSEVDLEKLANRFAFLRPRWLEGVWFMEREATS
jgi:FkbM family methyltransferase